MIFYNTYDAQIKYGYWLSRWNFVMKLIGAMKYDYII